MPVRNTTQIAQPIGSTISLPTGYPKLPSKLTSAFPEFAAYHAETERIYKLVRESFRNSQEELALPSKTTGVDALYASIDGLTASLETERNARIAQDTAIVSSITSLTADVVANFSTTSAAVTTEAAARASADSALSSAITALTATVSTNYSTTNAAISTEAAARASADTAISTTLSALSATVTTNNSTVTAAISTEASARAAADSALTTYIDDQIAAVVGFDATAIEARLTTIETTYATQTFATAKKTEAISASNGYTDAAITTEQTANATVFGHLSSKYTLKVAAGDIVTGMNITSSTGGGTDISDITFQATSFKVYNGTTGVAPFQIVSGVVRVNALTIANTDVSGLGTLSTQNDVSYGSITGTKPPSNADVTLSAINGGLSITGGGLVLASGGAAVRGGQTAFDTGTGFWLGDVGGVTKFSLGNSAGNKVTWNGSTLAITGTITSTSGTIGGFSIGASSLSAGTLGTTSYLSISSVGTATWGSTGNRRVIIGGNLISGTNASGNNNFWVWNNPGTNAGEIFVGNSAGSWVIDLNGDTGSISATSFSGSGSGLTSLPASQLTGSLPAISGASLTNLNASNIASGTINNARLSGVLLASNNLSDVTASTARSNLGLSSMATQASSGVSISGGTVDGVTSDGIVYSGVTHSGTSRMAFGYDGTNWGLWIDGSLRYVVACNV